MDSSFSQEDENQRDSPVREINQQNKEGPQEQEATQENSCEMTTEDSRVDGIGWNDECIARSKSFSNTEALYQAEALCT